MPISSLPPCGPLVSILCCAPHLSLDKLSVSTPDAHSECSVRNCCTELQGLFSGTFNEILGRFLPEAQHYCWQRRIDPSLQRLFASVVKKYPLIFSLKAAKPQVSRLRCQKEVLEEGATIPSTAAILLRSHTASPCARRSLSRATN